MLPQANQTIESLRSLHRIHQQLAELNARLRRGPNLVRAHEANVQHLQDELNETQQEAKTLRMANDAKQGQLKDGEEKVKRLKGQLNTASSNREYQALKDQTAAIEMTNSVLADEILEGLERLDSLDEKLSQSKAVLDKTRTEAEKVRKEVQQDEPRISGDIQRLENELKQCVAGLPGDFKPIYQRALRALAEDALAPLQGEYCGGCHQHVPLNAINKLMLDQPDPLVCQSCGRLLYVPEHWVQGSRR